MNKNQKNNLKIAVSDTIKAYSFVHLKDKIKGKKKGKRDIYAGADLYKKTGDWNHIDRVIDRENDLYKEIIKDKDGNIIRQNIEPLSRHKGHGFTKSNKKK